jgi:hypothetical protein
VTLQMPLTGSGKPPQRDAPRWRPYPKPQRRVDAAPGTGDDPDTRDFWSKAWAIAGSRQTALVLQALAVDTMDSWLAQGRTLQEAITVLHALKLGQSLDEALDALPPAPDRE